MREYTAFHTNHQYKANLHAHSTVSDGRLDRREMVECYKKKGYQVLAFTEHEIYTNTLEYDAEDFLVLPGIERSVKGMPDKEEYHINGIGDPSSDCLPEDGTYIEVPEYQSLETIQQIIDELKAKDNFVALNHPYWSCNRMEHFVPLKNYDAIEIYNFGCEALNGNGYSEIYYDYLNWKGISDKFALATDDNHNGDRYDSEISLKDSFGGWIQIVSEKFDRESIFRALSTGMFYASEGPAIYNYGVQNSKLFVECSECAKIIFITYPRRGYAFQSEEGMGEHEYTLRGGERVARIVCVDREGKKAWTNTFQVGNENL